MKKIFVLLFLLFFIPHVLAIDLTVDKISSDESMIVGFDQATVFRLNVTNNGATDNFQFYTFFGSGSYPEEPVTIAGGKTRQIDFGVYPRSDEKKRGYASFNLMIKASDDTEQTVPLVVNILELKDAFLVGSQEFNPETNSLEVYMENKLNRNFNSTTTEFKSSFFDFTKTFSLAPYEKKSFYVQLDKDQYKELVAGFYTLTAKVNIGGSKADVEGTMKFSEKDILNIEKKTRGFFIRTTTITKSNEGNTISESETVVKKNIITRLFTTLTPSPDIVDRQGAKIYYTWDRQIKPGETMQITVRTNWFMPLLVIFLIVAIVVFIKKFSRTNLMLRKRVRFVRAKGGEFALKISLVVTARKYVEHVHVIDRLPPLVKLHERFGTEKPSRVSEETKRIEWNFEKLEEGESRVLSYIIYSKVGVLGKFALPTATALYEREGDIHEAESNRAYFVAEQLREGKNNYK